MKLRLWPNRGARAERIGKRLAAKQAVQGDMDKLRKTQSRAYEPHNQNQGYGSGFGGGGG